MVNCMPLAGLSFFDDSMVETPHISVLISTVGLGCQVEGFIDLPFVNRMMNLEAVQGKFLISRMYME
jgi:hypothetical protein